MPQESELQTEQHSRVAFASSEADALAVAPCASIVNAPAAAGAPAEFTGSRGFARLQEKWRGASAFSCGARIAPGGVKRGLTKSSSGTKRQLVKVPTVGSLNTDQVAVDLNDVQRLERLIKIARKKLEGFSAALSAREISKWLREVGGMDGAGMLVRMARLDLDGDGRLSPEEYARFMQETDSLFEGMKSSVLNQSVVSALLLVASAPFILVEVLFPQAWTSASVATETAELLGVSGGSSSAWGDAAAFFEPEDAGAAARIRRHFFVLEVCALTLI